MAAMIAVGVTLIVVSLGVAAVLPRGHRAADRLRAFAAQVPSFVLGGIGQVNFLIFGGIAVVVLFVVLFS